MRQQRIRMSKLHLKIGIASLERIPYPVRLVTDSRQVYQYSHQELFLPAMRHPILTMSDGVEWIVFLWVRQHKGVHQQLSILAKMHSIKGMYDGVEWIAILGASQRQQIFGNNPSKRPMNLLRLYSLIKV